MEKKFELITAETAEMHSSKAEKIWTDVNNAIKEITNGTEDTTPYMTLVNALNITTHDGKMEGYYSLSTSCLMNPRCIARMANPDLICHECFSAALQAFREGLADRCVINSVVLSSVLIPIEYFRTGRKNAIKKALATLREFRLESFGDVINVIHARNYLRLVKAFPRTLFGMWTKNPDIWEEAIELEGGKPENLVWNESSPKKNERVKNPSKHADHVFTVYDLKHALELKERINCPLSCADCGHCYNKGNEFDVREILKKDSKKYWKTING